MRKVYRNLALEQATLARANRIATHLRRKVKAKLDRATNELLAQFASGSKSTNPYTLAQKEVRNRFALLSSEQSNLLSFYLLAEAARVLSNADELKKRLEGMNEMSEMTSLRLQMMMDRKSKFISTLSNILKKISDTQDAVVQNLK